MVCVPLLMTGLWDALVGQSINQRSGIATCFVEVLKDPLRSYKEIEDGQGTLSIVGSLQDKENTENPITEKFKGAMNYRCTFPIEIRKNLSVVR